MRAEGFARKHNLFPLFYNRLLKLHREHPSQEIAGYLQKRKPWYLDLISKSIRQEILETKLLLLFSQNQIPAIVIKGNALARDVYNTPNCRSSVDIDILIKEEDAFQVDAILSKAGYSRHDNHPLSFWLGRIHHAAYAHSKSKDAIEIHWNFSIPDFFNLKSHEIWEGVKYNPSSELKLTPQMTLILLFMHHHMHAFREFRNLLDLCWAFQRFEPEIDWTSFSNHLVKIGLSKTTRLSIDQINTLWPDLFSKSIGMKTVERELINTGKRLPDFLKSYFKPEIENHTPTSAKKDLIFFRFALDRWPTILFSFIKTFLPFPESIKTIFQDHRTWMLPVNYLKFIKWRMGGLDI